MTPLLFTATSHSTHNCFCFEQQGKTALGVAARADEVIIVDMIIKAERYFTWRRVMLTENHNGNN